MNTRDNRINVAVVTALIMWLLSVAVLFLAYSDWWDRIFDSDSISATTWLVDFKRLAWFRVPAIWSICSALYGLGMRESREAFGIVLVFPVVYLFTLPGLGGGAPPGSSHLWMYALLLIIHGFGANVVWSETSTPVDDCKSPPAR